MRVSAFEYSPRSVALGLVYHGLAAAGFVAASRLGPILGAPPVQVQRDLEGVKFATTSQQVVEWFAAVVEASSGELQEHAHLFARMVCAVRMEGVN